MRRLVDRLPRWEEVRRWHLTIAYVLLAAAVIGALAISLRNQDRIEDEAARTSARIERNSAAAARDNCLAINEAKTVLLNVLQSLAAPRPDDEPGDDAHRRELLEQVAPLVQPSECPPPPERGASAGDPGD